MPASTPELDRGLTLGDGVFDTSLCLAGTVLFRGWHLERLEAALVRLAIPVPPARLAATLDGLAEGDAALRLQVTRGPGPRGLAPPTDVRPSVIASRAPWDPARAFRPLGLLLAEARRNERSHVAGLKVPAYLDAVLESARARAAGADEVLFLNTRDRVACAAAGNVFLLDAEGLVTPPLTDGVVPGVLRRWVLERAPGLGIPVVERSLELPEVEDAELLVTSSLRLLAPARLGAPRPPSDRVRALQEALTAEVEATCGVTLSWERT